MGTRTQEGYPIPADQGKGLSYQGQTYQFPYSQAGTIVTTAVKLGMDGFSDLLDNIRKLPGDTDAIGYITDSWRAAAQELTYAVDGNNGPGLETAKENLLARWNGTAREAAVLFADRVIVNAKSNRDVLLNCAAQIEKFRTKIVETYIAALTFVNDCANAILEYSDSLMDTIKGFFGGGDADSDDNSVADLLRKFKDNVVTLFNAVLKAREEVVTALTEIRNQAAKFEVPAPQAEAASDIGSWQPRKPTGSPIGTGN